MEKIKLIELKKIGDNRGALCVFQENTNLPFPLKRVFYSYGMEKDVKRGCHANRQSEFVLIAVSGSCKVMADDGKNRSEFLLNKPAIGLYCGKMVWKEMYDFSPDCVLLVLSSALYDSAEYIKDYSAFLTEVSK